MSVVLVMSVSTRIYFQINSKAFLGPLDTFLTISFQGSSSVNPMIHRWVRQYGSIRIPSCQFSPEPYECDSSTQCDLPPRTTLLHHFMSYEHWKLGIIASFNCNIVSVWYFRKNVLKKLLRHLGSLILVCYYLMMDTIEWALVDCDTIILALLDDVHYWIANIW